MCEQGSRCGTQKCTISTVDPTYLEKLLQYQTTPKATNNRRMGYKKTEISVMSSLVSLGLAIDGVGLDMVVAHRIEDAKAIYW